MKLMLAAVPAITLVLAGCMANQSSTEDAPVCNEARARSYLGAEATGRNLAEARIAARADSVGTRRQGAGPAHPAPGVLIIEVDNANIITDVTCG